MGDVGAVAKLVDTLASWVLDPAGYATWSRERKLDEIHTAAVTALAAGQYDVLDRLLAELRRLRESGA